MRITSKYKLFGGFGLLVFINIIIDFLLYKVLINGPKIHLFDLETWFFTDSIYRVLFILGLWISVITLLMTQAKYILIDGDKIIFVNPIIPFIKKRKLFKDYDCYMTVDEYSQGGTYQAIWLIKDNKLKDRISSFYYTNYIEIKRSIGAKYNGKLRMNPFMQILYLAGMKIEI